MDFFSKLSKKASKTYQITKEKAATISEELKLKGKISDSKDKIEDLYKEIGQKVFEEIKAGRDVIKEEISEKIEKISSLEDDIEKYEVEILALKKIKKCSECETELELDAEFCSKCGSKQEKVEVKQENQEVKENSSVENNPEVKNAEVIEVKDVENSDNNNDTNNQENENTENNN